MPTLARQSSDYFFANRRKNYSPFVGKILFHLSRWGILKTVSASRWCLRCPHRLPQKLNLSQILSPACKMCIIIAVLHARFTSSIYRHQGAAYRRAGLPADRDQGYVAPGTGRTTRAGGSHHPHRTRGAGTAIGTRRGIKIRIKVRITKPAISMRTYFCRYSGNIAQRYFLHTKNAVSLQRFCLTRKVFYSVCCAKRFISVSISRPPYITRITVTIFVFLSGI